MKIMYLRLAYAQNPYLRFSATCGPFLGFWEGKTTTSNYCIFILFGRINLGGWGNKKGNRVNMV
jgi:hypothetical protein